MQSGCFLFVPSIFQSLTIATFFWAASSSVCFARLGETAQECLKRYGQPTKVYRGGVDPNQDPQNSGNPYMMFKVKGGIWVRCEFLTADPNCRCDTIGYVGLGQNPNPDVVAGLMEANSQGSKWKANGAFNRSLMYIRDDGARASFTPQEGVLIIHSKEYCARMRQSIDSETKETLKGF